MIDTLAMIPFGKTAFWPRIHYVISVEVAVLWFLCWARFSSQLRSDPGALEEVRLTHIWTQLI